MARCRRSCVPGVKRGARQRTPPFRHETERVLRSVMKLTSSNVCEAHSTGRLCFGIGPPDLPPEGLIARVESVAAMRSYPPFDWLSLSSVSPRSTLRDANAGSEFAPDLIARVFVTREMKAAWHPTRGAAAFFALIPSKSEHSDVITSWNDPPASALRRRGCVQPEPPCYLAHPG